MPDEMKFEDALQRLRDIVSKLNSGDVKLEETIRLFEEGVKLADLCRRQLEDAKLRIETLAKDLEPSSKKEKRVYRADESIRLE